MQKERKRMKTKSTEQLHKKNQELVYIAQMFKGKVSGNRAISKLLKLNEGLIHSAAFKLKHGGENDYMEDILNACRFAIVPALESYKSDGGALFITWWVFNMRASVQEWRRFNRGGADQGGKWTRMKDQYRTLLRKGKAYEDKAKRCKLRMEEVKGLQEETLMFTVDRGGPDRDKDLKKDMIHDIVGVVGSWTMNGVGVAGAMGFREWLADKSARANVTEKSRLKDIELDIIVLYYEDGLTYRALGNVHGISRERVRQIRVIAERKLKLILKGVKK